MAGGVTPALGVGKKGFFLCGKGNPSRWSYPCTIGSVDRPMHRFFEARGGILCCLPVLLTSWYVFLGRFGPRNA